jgi:hypothetical protein
VRGGNFSNEIPYGISSGSIVEYGTGCQGDAKRSDNGPKLTFGATDHRAAP